MSGAQWPAYDMTRFVAALLAADPQDPKLPFDDEHERARVADQRRDADREATLLDPFHAPEVRPREE